MGAAGRTVAAAAAAAAATQQQRAAAAAEDCDATTPLLAAADSIGSSHKAPQCQEQRQRQRRHQQHHHQQQQPAGADVGRTFTRRAVRLLLLAGPLPALWLPLLAAADAAVGARAGAVAGRFYQIFVDGRRDDLAPALLLGASLYAAAAALTAGRAAFRDWLALRWRRALALRAQRLYCTGDPAVVDAVSATTTSGTATSTATAGIRLGPLAPPYYAARLSGWPDGPDQRATQDLAALATALADVLAALAGAPVGVGVYSLLAARAFGGWAPVGAAAAFFAAGAALQRLAAAPVARLVFEQDAAEGALRRAHARVREVAEEAAFSRGGAAERRALDARFEAAYGVQRALVWRRLALRLLTGALDYGGALLNYCCLAAAVFGGAWDADGGDGGGGGSGGGGGGGSSAGGRAARVSVASFYLLMLVNALTQVLDLADRAADLAGAAARVSELLEFCGDGGGSGGDSGRDGGRGRKDGGGCGTSSAAPAPPPAHAIHHPPPLPRPLSPPQPPVALSLRGLDVVAATGAPVVRGLDLRLPLGSSLLVTGPTGAGKSTLLRVLASLWAPAAGAASLPAPGRVFFAPQRPFAAPPGTLREQLLYPDWPVDNKPDSSGGNSFGSGERHHMPSDAELLELLCAVGLGALAQSPADLGAARDWRAALSPGELQRLAFARALRLGPALAVLDEPTSALPEDDALRLLGLLAARGVAYVTVGHQRALLARAHRLELRLLGDGEGSWRLVESAGGGSDD